MIYLNTAILKAKVSVLSWCCELWQEACKALSSCWDLFLLYICHSLSISLSYFIKALHWPLLCEVCTRASTRSLLKTNRLRKGGNGKSKGKTANSNGETANSDGKTAISNGEIAISNGKVIGVFFITSKILWFIISHFVKHAAHVSSPSLFLLSFLLSFPCLLPFCSSHTANQCNSHSVPFQATASGFTWLSLAGLFYCSRGWLLPGISTLLGPWLVHVSAQSVSARCWWHFAVVLPLGRGVCHEGRGSVCSQTLRFLPSRAPAKWPGK